MERRRRSRTIMLALAAIVLCVSVIVGGTFALFTDSVTVTNHLQAGTLKITLVRTAHSFDALDEDGYLSTTAVEDEAVDAADIDNAFGLSAGALIAPQSVLSATFEIQNNDTVAFDYSVKIIVTDGIGGEELDSSAMTALHEQLQVELTDLSGTHYLNESSESLTVNGGAPVTVNQKATFTVTVTFIDDTTINNLAQNENVYFDLVVSATQHTTRPE